MRNEGAVAARLLGDRHRQQRLAPLAQFGALGDVAEAVEVEVGAGIDGDEDATARLAQGLLARGIFLQAGEADGAGRLGAGHGCRRTMSFTAAQISSVETRITSSTQGAADAERLLADLAHGDAVGEQADLVELDAHAGRERLPSCSAHRPARRR